MRLHIHWYHFKAIQPPYLTLGGQRWGNVIEVCRCGKARKRYTFVNMNSPLFEEDHQ